MVFTGPTGGDWVASFVPGLPAVLVAAAVAGVGVTLGLVRVLAYAAEDARLSQPMFPLRRAGIPPAGAAR